MNKRDGGNRRFILVEMEDYADKLTAERVRRVIDGYEFSGTQRTELFRQKVTWSTLKAGKSTDEVEKTENLFAHEYDKIKEDGRRRRTDRHRREVGSRTCRRAWWLIHLLYAW